MHFIVLIGGLSTTEIFAIISIALIILVPSVAFLANRRRKIKALYEVVWKKSTRLKPSEILGKRAELKGGFHKYYYNRNEDIQLDDFLKEGKNTILIGNPLAGKSRTIYHAMKYADKPYSVLIPKVADIISTDFRKPMYWKFWRKKILILDDLNKFVERQNFSYFMNEFAQKSKDDITILATCRTEPEFEKLKPEILSVFEKRITFERFPDKQAEDVAKKAGRKLPDRFDGNIGSIFVDIDAMRDRYKTASKEETSILKATKRLYVAGIYEGNQLFRYERVKTVCDRIFGLKLGKYQLDEILDKLVSKGFILKPKGLIWLEETYLDRVIEDDFETLDNLNEMLVIFSDDPVALFKIGNRAGNIGDVDIKKADYMKIAILAFKRALKFWTLEQSEENYAMTQNNLAAVYGALADVEYKAENCQLAIRALNEGLKVRTLKRFPIDYATTQNNLANVYRILADVEHKAENCRLAIKACSEALKVRILKRFPIDYAMTQNILAATYGTFADVEDKAENCRRAIEAYNGALKVITIDRFDYGYAMIQNNLGVTFRVLAEVENKAENCRRAINACNDALKVCTLQRFPLQYAMIENNLGTAYGSLAFIEDKAENCRLAINAYNEALRVYNFKRFPMDYAMTLSNLGNTHRILALVEDRAENYRWAVKAFHEALKVKTLERFPTDYAKTSFNLGLTYFVIATEEDKKANCDNARKAFEESLKGFEKENRKDDIERVKTTLLGLEKFCKDSNS